MSKQFEGKTDRKEKYYGIDYSFSDIAKERIEGWRDVGYNENLKLHRPNDYIPVNLELVEREAVKHRVPQLIKKDKFSNVWFLQDTQFNTPRAFYGIHLKNPFLNFDPASVTLMSLYCRLLNESLAEFASHAEQAGIPYLVQGTHDGLLIEVDGYNQKLPIILTKVMDKILNFDLSRDRFEKLKESDHRYWKGFYRQSISVLLHGNFSFLMLQQHTVLDMVDSMHQVTFEELQSLVKRFLSRLFINLFVHGNVTRKDVDVVESLTKDRIIEAYQTTTVSKSSFPIKRSVRLDDNSFYIYQHTSEHHYQSGILQFYQIGLETPAEIVKVDLLTTLLSEKFYHHMRTEQQLGYSVQMGAGASAGVRGLKFFIQSSYKPQYLDNRIELFIEFAGSYLSDLSEDDFEIYKKSLAVNYSEPFKILYDQSVSFWFQIIDNTLAFNKREIKLKELEKITKDQIVSLFNEHLVHNKRKLSIRLIGQKKIPESEKDGRSKINDLVESSLADGGEPNEVAGEAPIEAPSDRSKNKQPKNEPEGAPVQNAEPAETVEDECSEPEEPQDDADEEIPAVSLLIGFLTMKTLDFYPNFVLY